MALRGLEEIMWQLVQDGLAAQHQSDKVHAQSLLTVKPESCLHTVSHEQLSGWCAAHHVREHAAWKAATLLCESELAMPPPVASEMHACQ